MKLYLAGPLFSTSECSFNISLAKRLRAFGHEVFLPQENEQRSDRPDLIFKSDIAGLDWADIVVANLDGSDPDSGTCWELGYAYGKGKPSLVYRTDFRLFKGNDPINLMMTESANAVVIVPHPSVYVLAEHIVERLNDFKEVSGLVRKHDLEIKGFEQMRPNTTITVPVEPRDLVLILDDKGAEMEGIVIDVATKVVVIKGGA